MIKRSSFIEFDAKTHRYFVNGAWLPSVTQILHGAGYIDDRWFDELSRWRGSEVHRYTMIEDRREQIGEGKPLDLRAIPKPLRGYLKAWRRYKLDAGVQLRLVEYRVTCSRFGYAGTLDRVFVDSAGREILCDLKTSIQGSAPAWVRLQVAAYGHALAEGRWWQRSAVCLRRDGTYRVSIYPASDFQRDLGEFIEAAQRVKR